jgi:pimeloyl-ACP methyl ester carboxylesterase
MEELDVGSATLIGAGMGGTVAAQLAVDDPDMVEKLVLIAPEIYGPRPSWTEFFFRVPVVGPALTYTYLGGGSRAITKYASECNTGGWCPTPADLEMRQAAAMVRGTTAALVAFAATPRAATVPADLAQISAPTLVIWGDNDQVTPLADGRRLNEAISGSTLEVLPGVGHRPHRQEPATIASLIAGFLAS